MTLKSTIRRGIHALGYDLKRLVPHTNPSFQLLKMLEHFNIDLIFDVGANTGQFGTALREVGYKGRLVSFEPLSDAHGKLEAAATGDARWSVHKRCAIGSQPGETKINISGNSVSSSVLPMLSSHETAAAGSAYVGSENVTVETLDQVARRYYQKGDRMLLKIDTQGYEWEVLDGATDTLRDAVGVLCELSLVPLYEGQHLWRELIDRMESAGFTLWYLQRGFTDGASGRSLQMDAAFIRL